MSVTLCGKCLTPEATCGCPPMLRKGLRIRMVSTPRPESQHCVGLEGVILEDPDENGVAQAQFSNMTHVCVSRDIVEVIPVSGNEHADDAYAYITGGMRGGKTARNHEKLRELLASGKLFIPGTGKADI